MSWDNKHARKKKKQRNDFGGRNIDKSKDEGKHSLNVVQARRLEPGKTN